MNARQLDGPDVHPSTDAGEAMAEDPGITPQDQRMAILKARSKDLARESGREDEGDETIEIVVFLLAYETYGIESAYVREVYPLKELTPLPCTPSFVLGVFNVRGQILSVIDLKRFFDLPEKGLTDLNKVIVLGAQGMEFGVLADEILGVSSLRLSEMQASLPTLTGVREAYLKGVTSQRIVVLDARKLLYDQAIVVHEDVGT